MDDNIVEVIPGIFGGVQPTGCIISTLTKSSMGYANKRLRINGEGKRFTVHRLVLEHSLGLRLKPEYFACHNCEVRNHINCNHLWEGSRLENSQDRCRKGRIKNVESTSALQPQKQLRGIEIISAILAKIQPNVCRICTLAKRSDCYAIKGKINGKTKTFYAHRLVGNTNWEGLSNPVILRVTVATLAVVSIPTICGKEPPPITPAMPFVPGQICPNRKLKPEKVREIRYLLSEGISKTKIARTFAISRSQIILLARGEIEKELLDNY